jgi:hypothetical protein
MATHWFLKEDHTEFRNAMASIIDSVSMDLIRPDAWTSLGDEHDQCQYLFTRMYALMQERTNDLSKAVLCCSKIPDPVIELRYYRSRVKRSKNKSQPQFIEKETGADFALVLDVNFPGILQAQRSVLGQAKILKSSAAIIDDYQLERILQIAGPESAAYLIWGENQSPIIISAENIASMIKTQGSRNINRSILPFGLPLSEFFLESFVGLWFGRNYNPEKENERPPETSIAILYHFLHMGVPPPNVIYLGILSGNNFNIAPGLYINDVKDL